MGAKHRFLDFAPREGIDQIAARLTVLSEVESQLSHTGSVDPPTPPVGGPPAALPLPVDTTTAEAGSPPPKSTTPTAEEDPADLEPSLTNKGGRPPIWDFPSVIPLLEARKDKPFKDMAALKSFIQNKVQRVDGKNRGDGPDETTVERAITKHRLDKYVLFQK